MHQGRYPPMWELSVYKWLCRQKVPLFLRLEISLSTSHLLTRTPLVGLRPLHEDGYLGPELQEYAFP